MACVCLTVCDLCSPPRLLYRTLYLQTGIQSQLSVPKQQRGGGEEPFAIYPLEEQGQWNIYQFASSNGSSDGSTYVHQRPPPPKLGQAGRIKTFPCLRKKGKTSKAIIPLYPPHEKPTKKYCCISLSPLPPQLLKPSLSVFPDRRDKERFRLLKKICSPSMIRWRPQTRGGCIIL